MSLVKHLALLRGINVGGRNLVPMAKLQTCLADLGLRNVTTYIQSGNVLFESRSKDTEKLAAQIERELSKELLPQARVVVVDQQQLHAVVTNAPSEFLIRTEQYRLDVAFIKSPLQAVELLPTIRLKEEVDEAYGANGVLYLRRLASKAGQSRLPQLTAHPAYRSMTIRNWTTTTRLLALMSSG